MATTFQDHLMEHVAEFKQQYWYYFRANIKNQDNPPIDLEETLQRIAETKAMFAFIEQRKEQYLALFDHFKSISQAIEMGHGHRVSHDTDPDQLERANLADYVVNTGKHEFDSLIRNYEVGKADDIIQRHKAYLQHNFSPQDAESIFLVKAYKNALERYHFVPIIFLADGTLKAHYQKNYEDALMIYNTYVKGEYNLDLSQIQLPVITEEYLEGLITHKKRAAEAQEKQQLEEEKRQEEEIKAREKAINAEVAEYQKNAEAEAQRMIEEAKRMQEEVMAQALKMQEEMRKNLDK